MRTTSRKKPVPQGEQLGRLERFLLDHAEPVAIDTETTGLDWHKDKVFGISFSWRHEGRYDSLYIDLREGQNLKFARRVVPNLKRPVNHHTKFDAHMLREAKMPLPFGRFDCTMLREALIEENKYEFSLQALSLKYLGRGKEDIWEELAKLFGGKADRATQILNLHRAPSELVGKYANSDTLNALQIWYAQEEIFKEENLHGVHAVEMELLSVITDMERGGVRVDLDAAEQATKTLTKEIDFAQKELNRIAGKPINANSPAQVKELMGCHKGDGGFWRTKDGIILEETDGGGASLTTPKLYQSSLPEARHIVTIRGFLKARDTFVQKYILGMNHKGYIHATINQSRTEDGAGVYTGRLSITDPALQQIHKRNKKMAAIIRAIFVPDADCEWDCWDWSQVDFRCFAHYLNDPRINERYAKDPKTDFHKAISELTGLPRDRDEKTGGANAKQVNLAQVFGEGPGKLAKECNLPYTIDEQGWLRPGPEAEALFAKYHAAVPGVNMLRKSVSSVARSRGYIMTPLRRRIHFPGGKDVYKAAGLLYQGTAADMLKVKMCEVHRYIREEGPDYARYMLTVHDESDLSITPCSKGDKMRQDIGRILEAFGPGDKITLRIPILADHGRGVNWWEASK